MKKHHPKNERIKRQYFSYLEDAKRMDRGSVDIVAASISHFEQVTNFKDFAQFHIAQAKAYKHRLAEQRNEKTGKPLAKSTIHSRLMALKAFVHWLAGQPGYKSRISYSDADYFNPSANDGRIATAQREKRVPTIEQIHHVISRMPTDTDIQKRDRAIIAFTLLTGARDNAVASFSLKHVDLSAHKVFQDAREVRTKNRKTFVTYFFPVGEDIKTIVTDWIDHLQSALLFGPDDPIFPATKVTINGNGLFGAAGLSRNHWKNAQAIRKLFKTAFEAAGLPYANPHSFRDTLASFGERICRTPEEFKAWSQNLGHDHVLTTFTSYGAVSIQRQADIIGKLRGTVSCESGAVNDDDLDALAALVQRMTKKA